MIYLRRLSCGWGIHYAGTILRIEDTHAKAIQCGRIYAAQFNVDVQP